ncbi:MAG: cytidylate kinase-like family protein [Clostridia bacterium]|nr:cytidylate kinase-like family protein [Clostridia bacterium]
MDGNYVITIARQFGSLGRKIGKKLAKELNIAYYDRELIEKAAEAMGLPMTSVAGLDDKMSGTFQKMLYPLGISSSSTQSKLFETQKSIILDAANTSSCVIVGRCADYILSEHPNVLNVFVYADYKQRLDNCINDLHIYSIEAKKLLTDVDSARKLYHKFYTGYDFDSIDNKHLMVDSGAFGIDGSVELIKKAAKIKFNF